MGAVNGISASSSVLIKSFVGMRPIIIVGELCMTMFLFLSGIAVHNEWNMMAFVCINLVIISFRWSHGATALLYLAEVCVDSGTGFATSAQFICLIVISLSFDFLIKSPIGVDGTMWIFAGISFLGSIWCTLYLRETQGLDDK